MRRKNMCLFLFSKYMDRRTHNIYNIKLFTFVFPFPLPKMATVKNSTKIVYYDMISSL